MNSTRHLLRSLPVRQTIGYFGIYIGLGLFIASLGPTLPELAKNTGSHLDEISILFIARALGYLLGSLRIGKAYDRLPGHVLLAVVLLVIGGMLFLSPIISQLWLLAIVMLIFGVGEGGVDVGGNTLLMWVHGRKVGPFMNGLHFFFGVGAFITPILFAQTILYSGGIILGYWIVALYTIPLALWLIRTPAPPPPTRTEEEMKVPTDVLLVVLISAFYLFYVAAEASFGGWIFTYTKAMGLGGPSNAAYLTSAFWGALTAGRLLGIPIASRYRPRTILIVDMIGCLFSVGVILIWPSSLVAIWVGTIGLGFSMASLFPTMLLVAGRRMTLIGNVTRWFFVGAGLGGMILPWVIGQVFEDFGPQITMILIAFDLLLTLLIIIPIVRYPRASKSGVVIG